MQRSQVAKGYSIDNAGIEGGKGVYPIHKTRIPQFIRTFLRTKKMLPSLLSKKEDSVVKYMLGTLSSSNFSVAQSFSLPNRLMCTGALRVRYTACSIVWIHLTAQDRSIRSLFWHLLDWGEQRARQQAEAEDRKKHQEEERLKG